MKRFLAKSNPEETIQEHTEELIKRYYDLLESYPMPKELNTKVLLLACIFHDFGKMNSKFQAKVRGNKYMVDIPHNYLSPLLIPNRYLKQQQFLTKEERSLLAECIYFHHTRAARDRSTWSDDIAPYIVDLKSQVETFYQTIFTNPDSLLAQELLTLRSELIPENIKDWYSRYIINSERAHDLVDVSQRYQALLLAGFIRKIDYAASAHLPVEVPYSMIGRDILNFFTRQEWQQNDLQQWVQQRQDENIIVVASTGMGKTEAALFWSGNQSKLIFTLPLKVSSNAIYQRIIPGKDNEEHINIPKEHVALLHSGALGFQLQDQEEDILTETIEQYEQAKQLSHAVTICTLHQLLDGVALVKGKEWKLATLSYSKLVIDEIQAYSPQILGFTILALKRVKELGGKFMVMTATLPPFVFDLIQEHVYQSKEEIQMATFLKQNDKGQTMKRHLVDIREDEIDIDQIQQQAQTQSVLVIVNTITKAQELYNAMKNNGETSLNMLHSRFTKRDRAIKEQQIMSTRDKKAKTSTPGIWISTQIVEASLDIDFDVLHTELSELSGFFQRLGRVYRSRELEEHRTQANVFVYINNPSGIADSSWSVADYTMFKLSQEALRKTGAEYQQSFILTEEMKMDLINSCYTTAKMKEANVSTQKSYLEQVEVILNTYRESSKDSIADLMDTNTVDILLDCTYQSNREVIDTLIAELRDVEAQKCFSQEQKNERHAKMTIIKDTIRSYTITVYTYQVKQYKLDYQDESIKTIRLSKQEAIDIINVTYTSDVGIDFTQTNAPSFDEGESYV